MIILPVKQDVIIGIHAQNNFLIVRGNFSRTYK